MKYYRVLLNGQNFLINYEGKKIYMGFYTTRFVEASNSEEAELKAVNNIRNNEKLKDATLNKSWQKKAKIYLDEIYEIEEKDVQRDYGFGWYKMEGKNKNDEGIYKISLSKFGLKRR